VTAAEKVEDFLELIATSNNDSHAYCSEVKKQPKVVEVTVKERVFVVPFNLQGDAILVTIHGPVRIFVSGEQGTLFAEVFGHTALVQDGEVV